MDFFSQSDPRQWNRIRRIAEIMKVIDVPQRVDFALEECRESRCGMGRMA
jgi:hypothetical protein